MMQLPCWGHYNWGSCSLDLSGQGYSGAQCRKLQGCGGEREDKRTTAELYRLLSQGREKPKEESLKTLFHLRKWKGMRQGTTWSPPKSLIHIHPVEELSSGKRGKKRLQTYGWLLPLFLQGPTTNVLAPALCVPD